MQEKLIKIEAEIKADSNKVWEYYTKPEHITKWNFASDDWHCPAAHNDLRIDGLYRVRMEAKDGSFGFDLEAIYKEINVGKGFLYIMADGRSVHFSMHEKNALTHVTIEFEPENVNPTDLQRDGWQAILNNFKKYVEAN